MNKIYIIKLLKKDFIKLVGDRKTTGYSYFENSKPHKIFIKPSNKKIIKGTIEHELSHIILNTFNLKKKMNQSEFKRVLEDVNFRSYNKKLYNNSFKIREEYLVDLIAYAFYGTRTEKNYIKKHYPKNYKIILQEIKKFKPIIKYI